MGNNPIYGSVTEDGDGVPFESYFVGKDGSHHDGLDIIFPIVRKNSQTPWEPIGTGFFISTMGMFATARHVLAPNGSNEPFSSLVAIQISRSTKNITIRKIEHISLHPTADVAIGFLQDVSFITEGKRNKNHCFSLTRTFPSPNDKVVAFGFPNPITKKTNKGYEIQFPINPITGVVEEYCQNGAPLLKRHCFRTSMSTSPGTSGGPVASLSGKVFAIISAGIEGQPLNYVLPITEILDLHIPRVRFKDGSNHDDLLVRDLEPLHLLPIDWE
jgi:hypothetical protein